MIVDLATAYAAARPSSSVAWLRALSLAKECIDLSSIFLSSWHDSGSLGGTTRKAHLACHLSRVFAERGGAAWGCPRFEYDCEPQAARTAQSSDAFSRTAAIPKFLRRPIESQKYSHFRTWASFALSALIRLDTEA